MASGEYRDCPPRIVRGSAAHPEIASSVNQTVRLLVRDPSGESEAQAFLSTDLATTPERILGWFVSRWRMETTFQEVRAHLGVETQRQWSVRIPMKPPGYTDLKPPAVPISKRPPFQSQTARDGVVS